MNRATIEASKVLNESLSKYRPERKQHPFTEDARYKAENLTEANGDGIKTLYDGSKWLVQTPTTKKGAKTLAEGTKWLNGSDYIYAFDEFGKDLRVLTNKTNSQEKYYYVFYVHEGGAESWFEYGADINDDDINIFGFLLNDDELCSVPVIASDLVLALGFLPTRKGVERGIDSEDVEICLIGHSPNHNLCAILEPTYTSGSFKILHDFIEKYIQENPTSTQGKIDGDVSESVVAEAIAEVAMGGVCDCVWDDVIQTVANDWRAYLQKLLGGNVSISHGNSEWGADEFFNVEIPRSCFPAVVKWGKNHPLFDYDMGRGFWELPRDMLMDSLEACVKENNIKFDADKAIENAVAYQFKENKIDWNAVNREIAKSAPVRESISRTHRRYTKEDYSARPLRPLRPELLQSIKNRYPNGTRVELIQMEDVQAPPIGTKGTVYYVDDMGNLGVKWDNGSTLNVIYGVDSVKRINESRTQKPYRRYMTENRRPYNRNYRRPIRR